MVFSSPNLHLTTDHGIATLSLRFPGRPTNALDLDRLCELDAAILAVESTPTIRTLVLRSGLPTGFCEGLHPSAIAGLANPADAAAFSGFGQRVLTRLTRLELPTVAFIDGVCRDAGLELALACDYRLALANVAAPLGFPGRMTCLGGASRLQNLVGMRTANQIVSEGRLFSAREAKSLGFIDEAFCERRAKIELRSFLDSLDRRPLKAKPSRTWREEGLAEERASFAAWASQNREATEVAPVVPLPAKVGVTSASPMLRRLAADFAVRGTQVLLVDEDPHSRERIEEWRRRGFLTPLEADQAKNRLTNSDAVDAFRDADLVFASDLEDAVSRENAMNPRGLLLVETRELKGLEGFHHPQRVLGLRWDTPRSVTLDIDSSRFEAIKASVSSWLGTLGLAVRVQARSSSEPSALRLTTPSRSLVAA